MGKPTGFMEYNRVNNVATAPTKRIKDFDEFHVPLSDEERRIQGARCMDCGSTVLSIGNDDKRYGFRMPS